MRTNAMMLMLILTFVMTGCRDQEKPGTPKEETVKTQEGEEITLKYEFGVDAKAKKITIGALNDESGPAAALGKPWAIGKRRIKPWIRRTSNWPSCRVMCCANTHIPTTAGP